MLTNESGYVFLVYNDKLVLAGAFHRIEVATESVEMSLSLSDQDITYVEMGHTENRQVEIWQGPVFRGCIVKYPTNSIPVGMVQL